MNIETAETIGILNMLNNAGPVVKIVMLLLLLFSIISWTIIFMKFRYIRKASRESSDFMDFFWECRTLAEVFFKAKAFIPSPVSRIFMSAYMEMARPKSKDGKNQTEQPIFRNEISYLYAMDSVKRTLRRSIGMEIHRLTQLVPFLATAGNTSPFIGLFGTVWGIMNTFHSIGMSESASLAIVAPGISEALVATAAGLAVAIPSVIAYNYFTDCIRVLNAELERFSSDLLNIIERDLQKQVGESCN